MKFVFSKGLADKLGYSLNSMNLLLDRPEFRKFEYENQRGVFIVNDEFIQDLLHILSLKMLTRPNKKKNFDILKYHIDNNLAFLNEYKCIENDKYMEQRKCKTIK